MCFRANDDVFSLSLGCTFFDVCFVALSKHINCVSFSRFMIFFLSLKQRFFVISERPSSIIINVIILLGDLSTEVGWCVVSLNKVYSVSNLCADVVLASLSLSLVILSNHTSQIYISEVIYADEEMI